MKLKVLPAIQFILFAGLMWAVKLWSGQLHFNFEYQNKVSWIIIVIGILIGISAVISFRKVKTTLEPMHPEKASTLVEKGLYRYSRNPMYLALLLLLFALFIRLGNLYNLLILILFIWYITQFQIKPEEEALVKRFGEHYRNYKSKVRRWI